MYKIWSFQHNLLSMITPRILVLEVSLIASPSMLTDIFGCALFLLENIMNEFSWYSGIVYLLLTIKRFLLTPHSIIIIIIIMRAGGQIRFIKHKYIYIFFWVSNTNTKTNTPTKIWSNTNTNTAHQIKIQIHTEAKTKLPPFYGRHIWIHCIVRKLFYLFQFHWKLFPNVLFYFTCPYAQWKRMIVPIDQLLSTACYMWCIYWVFEWMISPDFSIVSVLSYFMCP